MARLSTREIAWQQRHVVDLIHTHTHTHTHAVVLVLVVLCRRGARRVACAARPNAEEGGGCTGLLMRRACHLPATAPQ
jgi:hypothetical protein